MASAGSSTVGEADNGDAEVDSGSTATDVEATAPEGPSTGEAPAGQAEPAANPEPGPGRLHRAWLRWRRIAWGAGGFLAALVLGACATITWQALDHDDQVRQQAPTHSALSPQNPQFATSTDDETRFRISFPLAWATRKTGGADVRLVAGPGGGDLMSVRVVSLAAGASGPPTPDGIKPYLDTIVNEPGVTVLQQNPTQLGGLPGWYYTYAFKDPATGQQGVHAQYFALRGNQLFSVVFQALPGTDFPKLAPAYQQVANSVQFF